MLMMRKIVFLFIVCLPVTVWSANLKYTLDVQINTAEQKIIGAARLKADADIKLDVSVQNLKGLKVNGKTIDNAVDDHLGLSLQNDQEIIINYEAYFTFLYCIHQPVPDLNVFNQA